LWNTVHLPLGDYYTTTKYKIKNKKGDMVWVEVPRDFITNILSIPKIDQEGFYTMDNTSNTEQRTYGYFWREYLWYNPIKSVDYTKLNITSSRGTIDTIQKVWLHHAATRGNLWDSLETYWLFKNLLIKLIML